MPQPRLLDQVRSAIRLRHYSIRTEEAYVNVIRRFILYHRKRHPKEMGADEIRQYLSHLATDGNVAASTQNVALAALLFLYREVLQLELPLIEGVERAKRPQRIPAVLTVEEVKRVLVEMSGTHHLMASLLYGAGLRLMECVRLRVKDLDFDYRQIIVRDGKGEKDSARSCRILSLNRSGITSPESVCSTKRMCVSAAGESICLMRWSANIRRPRPNGSGNMSSLPRSSRLIRAQVSVGGIMPLKIG